MAIGQWGLAVYGLRSPIPPTGIRPRLMSTSASMRALRTRYTVPLVGDGYRAAEASVPGQRLHLALQVLQVRRTHFLFIYLFIHILQIHPASTQTRPLDRIHKIQRAGDDRGNETYCLLLQL